MFSDSTCSGLGLRWVAFRLSPPGTVTDLRQRRQRVAVVAWLSKVSPQPGHVSIATEPLSQVAASVGWDMEPRARGCTGA